MVQLCCFDIIWHAVIALVKLRWFVWWYCYEPKGLNVSCWLGSLSVWRLVQCGDWWIMENELIAVVLRGRGFGPYGLWDYIMSLWLMGVMIIWYFVWLIYVYISTLISCALVRLGGIIGRSGLVIMKIYLINIYLTEMFMNIYIMMVIDIFIVVFMNIMYCSWGLMF